MTPVSSLSPLLPKLLGAALSAIAAFILSAPFVLHTTAAAASWLFVTDWLTGIAAAALSPDDKVTSSEMRLKMQKKLVCYFQILSLGGAFSLMAHSWVVYTAAWGSVAAAEAWSIVENIRSSATAPEMAPIRAFLDRVVTILKSGTVTTQTKEQSPDE